MYRQAAADYSYPPSGGSQFQHPPGQGQMGGGRQWNQQGQMQHQQQQQQQQQWNQNQQQMQQQQQQQGGSVHGQGQNGQQQSNGASTTDAQSQAASGGAGQEMNLASVLHYLQSEWRRWERDRNEWEIERAEMRARIALLEGQRRSAENLKVDLLRRVKMLEFALRQERTKSVASGKTPTLAPSRLAVLQDEERGKEGGDTASEGSDESAQDRKPNGIAATHGTTPASASAMSRISSLTSRSNPAGPVGSSIVGPAGPIGESAWKAVGAVPPKDPKARARSREYLKQCLQEITYLTSPGALNPLPARAPITIERPASPAIAGAASENGVASTDTSHQTGLSTGGAAGTGQKAAVTATELPDRPRKSLPARTIPAPHAAEEGKEGTEGKVSADEQQASNKAAQPPKSSEDDSNAASAPAPAPIRIMKRDTEAKANGSPLKKQTEIHENSRPASLSSAASNTATLATATSSAVETLRKDARSSHQPPSSPARRSAPLPLEDDSSESDSAQGEGKMFSDVAREGHAGGDLADVPLGSDTEKDGGSTIHVTGADIATDAASDVDASERSKVGPLPPVETEDTAEPDDNEAQSELLTAIYRPESKAAWRDQLRHATEQAERARERSSSLSSNASASTVGGGDASGAAQTDEEQLHSISLTSADLDDNTSTTASSAQGQSEAEEKAWTSRKVLKSHLDIVRSVAFAGTAAGAASHTAAGAAGAAWGKTGGYAGNAVLVSGGDDCTVKVWSVAASALRSPKPHSIEVEPITTYRGHTMPITTVLACSPLEQLFSASLDSTIRVWTLPPASADPYAPYDASRAVQLLEGHTDAVWDLVMLPPSPPNGSGGGAGRKGKARLVSIGADKTLKVWERELGPHAAGKEGKDGKDGKGKSQDKDKGKTDVAAGPAPRWTLSTSHRLDSTPTCMSEYGLEQGKVVVGFSDGRVGIMSVEEGEIRWYGEKSQNLVNAVLCHPTWPIILAGYEDGVVRMWDARQSSRSPKHSIKAHPSAITGLTIPATAPDTLLTSATDCLLRVWDLNKRTAVQDCQGHRQKAGEGVVGVASHGELPFVASAGADGTVRLWSDV